MRKIKMFECSNNLLQAVVLYVMTEKLLAAVFVFGTVLIYKLSYIHQSIHRPTIMLRLTLATGIGCGTDIL